MPPFEILLIVVIPDNPKARNRQIDIDEVSWKEREREREREREGERDKERDKEYPQL